MLRSGISTKAQRRNDRTKMVEWQDVDIVDLSDEEFGHWFLSLQDEKSKFLVMNTLRKMAVGLSDFGDESIP